MMGNKVGIIAIAGLFLIGSLPFIIGAEVQEPSTRAPEYVEGHITTDQIWFQNGSGYGLMNVVIDPGVTVTIGPGVPIWFFEDSYLYIEGSLIVQGLIGDTVDFKALDPAKPWLQIQVNSTGYTDLQNFTIRDTSGVGIGIYGEGCALKNGRIDGGFQNIFLDSPGGHLIENMDLYNSTNFGISLYGNDEMTVARNIRVFDPNAGALASVSPNGTFENILCYNCSVSGMWVYSGSRNIAVKDFTITSPTYKSTTEGITIYPGIGGVQFENVTIGNCLRGIDFNGWSSNPMEITFKDLDVLSSVNNSIYSTDLAYFDTKFIDCDLQGFWKTLSINGSQAHQAIELINTTWNPLAPIEVLDGAYLNVSWYVDARITNGIADPIDSDLAYRVSGMGSYDRVNSPVGRFEKMVFRDQTIVGGTPPQTTFWDFQFIPADSPTQFVDIIDRNINEYTFFEIFIDLQPTSHMPASLELNEDGSLILDLYDHFTDPEGFDMVFNAVASPNLTAGLMNDPTSGRLVIRADVPDWYGTGWIEITATDYAGNPINVHVPVEVLPVNDAPHFTDQYPMRTIEEDTFTFFNFTGNVVDAEGDIFSITILERQDFTYQYNETTMNLTIWPAEDFFGFLNIEVDLSDGDATTTEDLFVNVTSVNDLPSAYVRMENGTAAPMVLHEGSGLMVYAIDLDEDTEAKFWLVADDVDSLNLTYSFVESDLEHGTLEVDGDPMNFSFAPLANDVAGDLVEFKVGDGVGYTTVWVWFNVTPVNDPIEFEPPSGWTITMDRYDSENIDLAAWITDVDGDVLTVTETSNYITEDDLVLSLYYDDTFSGASETITVTVSDGLTEVTADLVVNVNPLPELGDMKVKGEGDKWVVEVEGEEGADLWVVVEDKEGNTESYQMTYADGKYTAEVPKEDAEKGDAIWISWEDGGDPVGSDYEEELPSVEGEKETNYLCCFILVGVALLILILLFVLMVVIGAAARGRKGKEEEE